MHQIENLKALVSVKDRFALIELLMDVVDDGASVGFLPPLTEGEAGVFWDKAIADLNHRTILVARDEVNRILGSVQLIPALMPNQSHRAEVAKWHFFFAWLFFLNGLAYLLYGIGSRHLARDLVPTGSDWRGIGRWVVDHLRFRHATGEAAKRYNVLQKLAYLAVIFGVLPLVLLTGLSMSPWMNSVWPGWVDLLGGRQSGRTIHFVCAWVLVAFVLVHVLQVIVTGFWNNLRSMLTGRYRVQGEARCD